MASNGESNKKSFDNSRDYFNERPIFTCLVCCSDLPSCKLKAIFAIGSCNHMICYYCATKMRVLCEQMECPTCRSSLSEVIFTTDKDLKFSKLETIKCLEYNSRYKIYFENELCLTEFHRLQEVRCRICLTDDTLFSNLKELEVHLRKEHDRFLCELCVNHLKIFPNERKYYGRKELIRHKKTGDLDNKSYKGHSSCHLCDLMFFDEDDLLSHLKKDHFNCHFCDPSRTKMFFNNFQSLKKHFLDEHFVCEEGYCKDEEFSSAFANKIDLAAHKAQVHGSKAGRSMVVDLDFDFREGQNGLQQATVSYSHRNNFEMNNSNQDSTNEANTTTNQSVPTQEDFPSLATPSFALTSGSNLSKYALMAKNVTSLKKTNFSSKFQPATSNAEEFPALATTSSSGGPSFLNNKKISTLKPKQSALSNLKKGNKASLPNNQQASNLKYADIASSFPPLAHSDQVNESWNKPLSTFSQDDFPDMPIKIKKTKKKTQYINVKKEAEEKARKKIDEEAKKNESSSNPSNSNNFNDQQNNSFNQSSNILNNPLTNDGKMLSLKVPPGLHKLTQNNDISGNKFAPPPGFSACNNNNAFDMNKLGNLANELINSENKNKSKENLDSNMNLPSSSRTGYIYPSNFNERNENLLKTVKKELKSDYKFDQFRNLTDKFIRSHISGDCYFRKCLELFDKGFLNLIFAELLVLMPHIKKQAEIFAAYEKYFNYNKSSMQKQRNQDSSKGIWILTNEKIEFLVCPECGQVLSKDGKDGREHMNNHTNNQANSLIKN